MLFAWLRFWSRPRSNLVFPPPLPPPLVKLLAGEFVGENLCSIQKLLRRQTTCQQLKHFSFLLIIEFLYCRRKMKYTYSQGSLSVFQNWIVYLVFRRGMCKRDSSMIAFLLVFDNLMQGTTAYYWKIPLTFQIISCSCSSTAATKWNTVAIKILLLFETGLFIWFFGWGRSRHWIQRKWMLNMQAFTAEYRKGFW